MPSQWPLKSMLLRKTLFRRLGVIGRWQLCCTEAGGRTVGSSPRSVTFFDTVTAKDSCPPAPAHIPTRKDHGLPDAFSEQGGERVEETKPPPVLPESGL